MIAKGFEEVDMPYGKPAAIWAVVPVKRLAEAKQRLAPMLGGEREEFAFLVACRTLEVLVASGLFKGILVVTPDARVGEAARAHGAAVVDDAGVSLNEACALGLRAAVQREADVCVLLPSDLAALTVAGLIGVVDEYLRVREQQGATAVGLVRCKDGTGTNMVMLNPSLAFEPGFGPDSFAAHQRAAAERAREFTAPQVSFDVDSPDDLLRLAALMARDSAPTRSSGPTDLAHAALAGLVNGVKRRHAAPVNAVPPPSAPPPSTSPRSAPLRAVPRPSAPPPSTSPRSAPAQAPLPSLTAASFSYLPRAKSAQLAAQAASLRDRAYGSLITYSRKVFLPLTQLCRDSCHYCTFAKAPKRVRSAYMSEEEAVEVAARGAKLGCKEALFTLGEKPELRYRAARDWLTVHGFDSTLHYLAHVAAAVRDRTGLLPHINAGCMTREEMALLRPVSASMGLMLESSAARLCAKGGPHHGSPDKVPVVRLATIAEAGRQKIPFTTGILIGIGETREERIEALAAISDLQRRYGHIQEIIIQNFVPKPGTIMANAPAPDAEELLWTIAAARIVFGAEMSIQAPPNLSPAPLPLLIDAGINDWGGVSPLTPDFVNPEAPWPEIEDLQAQTLAAGKTLAERLTIYPAYAKASEVWLDAGMRRAVLEQRDGSALGREDAWRTGRSTELPGGFRTRNSRLKGSSVVRLVDEILDHDADHLDAETLATLFEARGGDFSYVCEAADTLRAATTGDLATYVVNRNINYTNICGYRCTFCAFSKGTRKHAGAERGYLLDVGEIVHRALEARARGATEVCLQGGIHPSFTGETYLEIVRSIKSADPKMHVHAFSPLEVWHGATTLGMNLKDYLALLQAEGLGSLPGTAAEILVDGVRKILCPDKLTTGQWLEVIETAHEVGLPTTSTIMFGHVDDYGDWATHLIRIRDLQRRTGGFTEFVPLPFVAEEAPLYKRGLARPGPTLRESILMHAVARLVLHPYFINIQASWVKLGRAGMREALIAGANDLGGTLMNESITRAAGAMHGQEMTASEMRSLTASLGRSAQQRTTLYRRVTSEERIGPSFPLPAAASAGSAALN